jgi:hypothetical protein
MDLNCPTDYPLPKGNIMRTYLSAAAIAALALGLAPAAAQAATAAPAPVPKPLVNPCTTFTVNSADVIFGMRAGTRLTEKLTSTTSANSFRTCTVTHPPKQVRRLAVVIHEHPVAMPKGMQCFARPKLGAHGIVCLSTIKTVHLTISAFRNRGHGYVTDRLNETLPRQGAQLYTFTLAQRKKMSS